MMDLVFIVAGIAFFALTWWLVHAFEHLRKP